MSFLRLSAFSPEHFSLFMQLSNWTEPFLGQNSERLIKKIASLAPLAAPALVSAPSGKIKEEPITVNLEQLFAAFKMFAVDITRPRLCLRCFGNTFSVCTSHRPIDVRTPVVLLWQNQFSPKTFTSANPVTSRLNSPL